MTNDNMYKFSEYRKSKSRPTNRVFIWLAFAVTFIIVLGIQVNDNLRQLGQLQQEYQVVSEKNRLEEVKKVELTAKINLLSDETYMLKLARNRFLLSLPQEVIFNIPELNNLLEAEYNLLENQE